MITAVYDGEEPAKDVLRQFSPSQRPRTVHLGAVNGAEMSTARLLVIDVDLEDEASLSAVKTRALTKIPGRQQIIVVAASPEQRSLLGKALPERARLMSRPLDSRRFAETVSFLLNESQIWQPPVLDARIARMAAVAPEHTEALSAGDEALSAIFAFARGEAPLKPDELHKQSETIVESLKDGELAQWITAVRQHHDGTYQHCMLVTGVAVAFGRILRIPQIDLDRLAFAALVHDIGKANVPVSILDKPGRLTDDEMEVMRWHPVIGAEIIARSPGIERTVVDVVRHHHEYLDGTGYPDGLSGDQIPDLVRIATIADIFGALVEKRAYKAPMSGLEAHEILVKMGPKLDQPLVRVMRAIARDF